MCYLYLVLWYEEIWVFFKNSVAYTIEIIYSVACTEYAYSQQNDESALICSVCWFPEWNYFCINCFRAMCIIQKNKSFRELLIVVYCLHNIPTQVMDIK